MQAHSNNNKKRGYTLLEVLLVVLIIGGLIAAIGIPSFIAIRKSQRVDNTATMIHSFKGACAQFETVSAGAVYPLTVLKVDPTASTYTVSPAGGFPTATAFSNAARFEQVLFGAGLIKNNFRPPMGNQAFQPGGWAAGSVDLLWDKATKKFVGPTTPAHDWSGCSRIICTLSNGGAALPSVANGANFQLAVNNLANMPANVSIVSAVIKDANAEDAYNLAKKYNPELLDAATFGSAQNRGQVVFGTPTNGVVDVYVYLAHL